VFPALAGYYGVESSAVARSLPQKTKLTISGKKRPIPMYWLYIIEEGPYIVGLIDLARRPA
jgi:hypothetical protein